MGKRKVVEVEAVDGRVGGREGPFILYFPAGPAPPGVRVHVYQKPRPVQAPAAARALPLPTTLVANAEAVDYVGHNFGGDAAASPGCRYAVGVYDESACTLKLVELGGDRVMRMQPRVRQMDYAPPPYVQPPSGADAKQTRAEQVARANRLAQSFGRENLMRKRAERKVARIEARHVSGAEGVEADLAAAAEGEMTESDILQEAGCVRNIPPHNPKANTPQAAYAAEAVITPAEQVCLKELVARLNKSYDSEHDLQALKESGKYQPLVVQYLVDHFGGVKPGERKRHMQRLAYLHALVTLMKSKFLLREKDLNDLNLPQSLQQPLLAKFAEPIPCAPSKLSDISDAHADEGEKSKAAISYQRPQEKRVLLLCYILLLCLMINDYDIEISHLALEFQLEPKDLSLYFSELGCIVTKKAPAEGQKGQHRARLLQADSRGKTLAELLPDRRPRPKAGKKN